MNTDDPGTTSARDQHTRALARIRRHFWLLVAATVVAVGVLSRALGWAPSARTGIVVAVSGLAALVSLTLAARILVVATATQRPLGRHRHAGHTP